jgi:hypothetical protein
MTDKLALKLTTDFNAFFAAISTFLEEISL